MGFPFVAVAGGKGPCSACSTSADPFTAVPARPWVALVPCLLLLGQAHEEGVDGGVAALLILMHSPLGPALPGSSNPGSQNPVPSHCDPKASCNFQAVLLSLHAVKWGGQCCSGSVCRCSNGEGSAPQRASKCKMWWACLASAGHVAGQPGQGRMDVPSSIGSSAPLLCLDYGHALCAIPGKQISHFKSQQVGTVTLLLSYSTKAHLLRLRGEPLKALRVINSSLDVASDCNAKRFHPQRAYPSVSDLPLFPDHLPPLLYKPKDRKLVSAWSTTSASF